MKFPIELLCNRILNCRKVGNSELEKIEIYTLLEPKIKQYASINSREYILPYSENKWFKNHLHKMSITEEGPIKGRFLILKNKLKVAFQSFINTQENSC